MSTHRHYVIMATRLQLRAEAKLVPLSYLQLGDYITGNETIASYVRVSQEIQFSRVNCIAAVIRREDLGSIVVLTIDDGSDVITVRIFDSKSIQSDSISVGQVILVVGKIREYHSERYIAAEIIKVVSPRWLKYRSLFFKQYFSQITLDPEHSKNVKKTVVSETKRNVETTQVNTLSYSNSTEKVQQAPGNSSLDNSLITPIKKEVETNVIKKTDIKNTLYDDVNPYLKLLELIQSLDSGSGVALEIIISESTFPDTEVILQKMMETGDIFQNMPGKVKVL